MSVLFNKQQKKERDTLPFYGIPKILPYVKPYRWKIVFMVLLGALSSLADSSYPLFQRYVLDHFVAEKTLQGLGAFIALYALVLVLQVLDNFICTSLCGSIEVSTNRDLRNAAFNHLQTLSFSYFNQNNVGYIHARIMSDTAQIGVLVAWRLMEIVWSGSYLLFVMVQMLRIQWKLALWVMILVPVAAVLVMFFEKKLTFLNRVIRELNSKITGNFNEGITGARSIKTLRVEDRIRGDFEHDTETMRKKAVHATRYRALFISSMTMMSAVALSLVLVKGGRMTMDGVILVGTLSVFTSYALNMMDPIQNVIRTLAMLVETRVNIERITKLLETQSDVVDTPEVVEKYGDTFHPKKENWEPLEGDVEFRDVTFQYPDGDELVLEHFDLKVAKGTSVAIVGETGAGKSTLVNLVCRFYEPTTGQVLIDGRDVRERSQLWLHSSIGYVLQSPQLFSGSVRDNLRYGKPDATDEEIMEALRLVSADGIVRRMDKGLDSEVGEGGDKLSTGEKQLLSFARALLADPRILILDEATSSIDTMTEKAIQQAIATVIEGRTSFVIAHRLSTIVDSNVILAVKDGVIVERGTHKELMKQRGYYYELYTRQYTDSLIDLEENNERTNR